MKTKYNITLEGNEDYLQVKSAKDKIIDMIPKGKTTTATLVAEVIGIHKRRALHYLVELEERVLMDSEIRLIQHKSGAKTKARIFKKL